MIKKQFRVGIGKNAVLRAQGLSFFGILCKTLLSIWIPKWHLVKPRISHVSENELKRRKLRILCALWVLRAFTALGQLFSFLRLVRK